MSGVPASGRKDLGRATRSGLLSSAPYLSLEGARGVGWYPHSGFIHIDTGPIRNWTLDERGLDGLLIFDARRPKLDGTGQVLLGGPRRPLSVAQRLTLQDQLARVEFLARIGLRVSP
jgi:hypothetical protein